MSFSPVPRYSFRELTDISAEFLVKLGIKFLMIDLDNTAAAYSEHEPSEAVLRWTTDVKRSDIRIFIVSNSVRKGRVETFATALGLDFIKGARKPKPKGLLQAMKASGFSPYESALVGDQIFTDALAANRAGITSIIVKPKRFTNPFLALRYAVEAPFRLACRNRFRA